MQTPTALRAILAAAMVAGASFAASPAIAQSNAGGTAPAFDPIDPPEEDARGVFVNQIGSGNIADARQSGGSSYARIVQQGDDNRAEIDQGQGTHYAAVVQDGDLNQAEIIQDGAGQTALVLAQQGNGNLADVLQRDNGITYSAAAISQSGADNSVSLIQDGSDNQARLSQNGDGNAMTAMQLGANNRLDWTQDGSGLSDLQIEQTGGAGLIVIQSNGGG